MFYKNRLVNKEFLGCVDFTNYSPWEILGIWVQNALGLIKISLMLFMVVTGFIVLITGKSRSGPSQLDFPHFFEGTQTNLSLLSMALFKVLYSFAGYGNVNNVMNEVRDPVRTLKSAAPAAMIIVTGTYLLINFAYFSVVPLEEIRNSGQLVAALFFTRVFGNVAGRIILPGMIAISALGNVFVVTYSESRINQGTGEGRNLCQLWVGTLESSLTVYRDCPPGFCSICLHPSLKQTF